MSGRIELYQTTVVYPLRPGAPGGPCVPRCSGHIECERMHRDAAALCPTCQLPLGYGAVQHLIPITDWQTHNDTGYREVSGEHEDCYQARLVREKLDAEAQAEAEAAKTPEATANA